MKTKNEKNSKFNFILKQKSNVPFDPLIILLKLFGSIFDKQKLRNRIEN